VVVIRAIFKKHLHMDVINVIQVLLVLENIRFVFVGVMLRKNMFVMEDVVVVVLRRV